MINTLADIKIGTMGIVLGFSSGSHRYRQKLLAMGLIKGTPFQVTRIAPMGDPVEIRVRGYNLSLRKEEAKALCIKEQRS